MDVPLEISPAVEEHTITVGGRQVHYYERPGQGSDLTLLGVNGLLGGGDSFWSVIGGVPAGVRVVLPDLPGCGGSEPLREEHTVAAYAAWLERLRTTLGLERLVLTSVATGAPITVRYAAQHPDQVAGLIFHLPMLGKATLPPFARPLVAYALRVGPLRDLIGTLRQNTALLERIIEHEPPTAIPELAARDIAHKQEGSLRAAGDLLHSLMLLDARPELHALRVPMLFLAAEHDPFAPLNHLQALTRQRTDRHLFVEWGGQHSWNEAFIAHMNREIAAFFRRLGVEE